MLNRFIHFFLCFLGFFLIAVSLWTHKYFGIVTIDQVISTIHFGLDGTFASDSTYQQRFINWCLFWPTMITIGLGFLLWRYISVGVVRYLSYSLFFLGLISIAHQFSLISYIKNYSFYNQEDDYFKLHYVDPKKIVFQPKQLKNLVIIYVESLEHTYADRNRFGRNLLQPLAKLKQEHVSYAAYHQMPGTGWTIAGIVSTQCGVPLQQLTIFNGNRLGENVRHFMPHVKCLSDILAEHHYKNVFMNGAATKIGGKLKFLIDHHYSDILGKEEWLKKGFKANQMNHWGLSDHDLFQQAKQKLTELMAQPQHFNLTILTVDTHGFSGQLSPYCEKKYTRDFAGIVECTAAEVADFVQFIKTKGWLDKIQVVILGDHLAMPNPLSDQLGALSTRSIYNLFISHQRFYKNMTEVTGFDLFPTILHWIGFEFEGHRLGLGQVGLLAQPPITLSSPSTHTTMDMNRYSQTYADFWT